MINKIRKKLIFMYTISTGMILTVVLVIALFVMNQQIVQNKKEAFKNNFMTVKQKVLMNNEISNLWLAEMETKSHLIIHIEDCGQALFYKGSWKSATDRSVLVRRLKKLAYRDKINTKIRPISTNEVQSTIYEFKGNKNDTYLGQVYMVSLNKGYRSILVLQYISRNVSEEIKKNVVIIVLYLAGILALFSVSRWIVGKSLEPVEESRKRQTQFIASASHELKSPLAVIRANTSAMMIEPENAEHFIKGIDKECVRLSSLVEDLLLLASTDAKCWNVKNERIDMDVLLIDIYDSFESFCKKNQKELKLELQEEMLPAIAGDVLRIKQILSVLIDNAVTYSMEGSSIVLRAYEKKNQLYIEVEDHGAGIEESMKREIFEKFYRGDQSRKDKNHYGLGLSIAKELTQLHGGQISVRDTRGGGATFVISFPTYKKRNNEK